MEMLHILQTRQGEHGGSAGLEKIGTRFSAMEMSRLGLLWALAPSWRHREGGNRATRHDKAGSGRPFRGWRGRESRDAAEDRESCSGMRGEPSPPWILPHHLCCLGFGIFHSLGEENGQVSAEQPPSQGSESRECQGGHRPAPHPNSTPLKKIQEGLFEGNQASADPPDLPSRPLGSPCSRAAPAESRTWESRMSGDQIGPEGRWVLFPKLF